MALGRVPDLRRSSFLLPKGCAACRGRGHLEARTACRSETNMPLVLILGQPPRRCDYVRTDRDDIRHRP